MDVQTALVTGGGSGIGRAICKLLAENGFSVIVTDVNLDAAEESASNAGDNASAHKMDVTSSSEVKGLIADTIANGSIEVLVNCAGWDEFMRFVHSDEDFWDRIIDLNYKGVLRTTHAVLPHMMQARYGRIINISSDAGRVGSSLEAVYSGTKGGVIAFTKTIAREVARAGITANCVCPGPTATPLLDEIADASDDGEKVLGAMERAVPMKRLGTPEDIANAVAFLAKPESEFITGQTLSVSGGLTMS